MSVVAPVTDRDLRRRLGQYFTGMPLARLLAELADARTARSVIDPMAGVGDMLAAVSETGARLTRLGAIEIEPTAYVNCLERLSHVGAPTEVTTEHGNSFDPTSWERLRATSWDLVITNPPYVRYQRSATPASGAVEVPSADAVRRGLAGVLEQLDYLDAEYRDALQDAVATYSGLADLAVPSWILCAALVRPGGTLAMLVPDTWLSRDYAAPLTVLLDRFFDVKYVVHDAEAGWFADASVRTTLFVAQRLASVSDVRGPGALHVRVDHRAASSDSLVGAAAPRSGSAEAAFAAAARTWRTTGSGPDLAGCQFEVPAASGRRLTTTSVGQGVPPQLQSIMTASSAGMTLEDLGWRIGQGLRTGANIFFYGSLSGRSGNQVSIHLDRKVGGRTLVVDHRLALPVVRSQADLPGGGAIDPDQVLGRVLAFQRHVRPEDRRTDSALEDHALRQYDLLPEDVATHISFVETLNIGSSDHPRFVPGLSAVRTNVRRFDPSRPDMPPRFWYQLPEFARRHQPDLCIARVNYRHPRAVLNPGRKVLIDANFSTLWRHHDDGLDPFALLALLTSTWAHTQMELLGTVLGGGALKLEATQLRRLVVPANIRASEDVLIRAGQALTKSLDHEDTFNVIDGIVFGALEMDDSARGAVATIARERLGGRTR